MSELTLDPKLDAFLSRLDKVRKNGSGFLARCPAHQDDDPSLSVSLGARGVVFHCFAGCDWERVLAAIDFQASDLFFDGTTPKTKDRRRDWRAIELESYACAARLQREPDVLNRLRFGAVTGHHPDVFEIVDGEHRPVEIRNGRGWSAKALEKLEVGWDGSRLTLPVRTSNTKLHDVLRYDPFATGKTRKILASKGKSRLPWPSPEYRDPKQVLFLVEGEGTAISMHSVGFEAVGLPGSVSKPSTSIDRPGSWRGAGWHTKWADRFKRFREVILLPDCDDQGRALMRAASYDLTKIGVSNHIIDIGPRANDGRDIADHLLSRAYDGVSRKVARNVIREMVAEQAEVLVA